MRTQIADFDTLFAIIPVRDTKDRQDWKDFSDVSPVHQYFSEFNYVLRELQQRQRIIKMLTKHHNFDADFRTNTANLNRACLIFIPESPLQK